jgi:hypothetical protein
VKVLVIEPMKKPKIKEIGNGLKDMQAVVGGYIQAIYPYEDQVALVCNEEGKLIGLPLNRMIEDYDIIAGTFFICGLGEEDFDSLSDELLEKYYNLFEMPQEFIRIGNEIVPIYIDPEEE